MGISVNYNKEYKLNQVQTWLVSSLGSFSTQTSLTTPDALKNKSHNFDDRGSMTVSAEQCLTPVFTYSN